MYHTMNTLPYQSWSPSNVLDFTSYMLSRDDESEPTHLLRQTALKFLCIGETNILALTNKVDQSGYPVTFPSKVTA